MKLNKLYNNHIILKQALFFDHIKRYGIKDGYNLIFANINYNNILNKYKNCDVINVVNSKWSQHFTSGYDIGFCIFGSIVANFVKWLHLSTQNYDNIWFLAREGYFFKKAFDTYSQNNKSVYFLTSRRASSVATIKNIDDIINILSQNYTGSLQNLLSVRLNYLVDTNINVNMPQDIDKVLKYIDLDYILQNATVERQNYMEYISSIPHNNIALVDIGYSGTIQYYLSKLLDKPLDGFYMCHHYNNKPDTIGAKCHSLYPVVNLLDERENIVFKNQLLLESIFKAPYGQVEYFDNNSQPVYNQDNSYDNLVANIQSGILDFIEQTKNIDISTPLSLMIMECGIKNIDKNILAQLSVDDKYCSNQIIQIH